MRKFFYGKNPPSPYFEGWYFKLQSDNGRAIALIPAIHIQQDGRKSASIQIISETDAWWLEYPANQFSACENRFFVRIGENTFSAHGVRLAIHKDNLSLRGRVSFGPLRPIRSDIMGPFRWFPSMECAHGVISMGNRLDGCLILNGEKLDYNKGFGYIESDRGRSFPQNYLWTQCCWEETSIMLSIATIPIWKLQFTGCICAIIHNGKEYRIATYKGAKVEKWSEDSAVVVQGKYRLEVILLEQSAQALRAPADGQMCRTVKESLCAKVHYRLWERDKLLIDKKSDKAGYEHSQTTNQWKEQ
jgi:hypothetical protein